MNTKQRLKIPYKYKFIVYLILLILIIGIFYYLIFELKIIGKNELRPIGDSEELFIYAPKIPVYQEFQILGVITAYTSDPKETDDTPFISASGQIVRKGIVANNCLNFGELVEIAGEIFEVQDRMSKKYNCEHYDIWKETKEEAIEFGVQEKEVYLYK
jgi:hypothetical protein